MVTPAEALPVKLKEDAITEALFEIRYEVSSLLPESTYIRLAAEVDEWKGFQQSRLPAYEIPASLRSVDASLKFQALVQLTSQSDEPCSVRLGTNVISFHRLKKYVGWVRFKAELEQMIDRLFEFAPDVVISRLGLRYLNAFTVAKHGIAGVGDLNLDIKVANQDLTTDVNLNYLQLVDEVGGAVVRVASPKFVNGSLPQDTTVFVDVDVSTPADVTMRDKALVKAWLERAHLAEKSSFYKLLKPETVANLREK